MIKNYTKKLYKEEYNTEKLCSKENYFKICLFIPFLIQNLHDRGTNLFES